MPFKNCTDAWNHGVFDIPRTSPDYARKLDRDNDGIGCEKKDAPAGAIHTKPKTTKTPTPAPTQTSTKVVEQGSGNGDVLPKTGPGGLVAVGLLLLVLGVALAMVLRRRKVRFTA